MLLQLVWKQTFLCLFLLCLHSVALEEDFSVFVDIKDLIDGVFVVSRGPDQSLNIDSLWKLRVENLLESWLLLILWLFTDLNL